jgi:hypothetical protein
LGSSWTTPEAMRAARLDAGILTRSSLPRVGVAGADRVVRSRTWAVVDRAGRVRRAAGLPFDRRRDLAIGD